MKTGQVDKSVRRELACPSGVGRTRTLVGAARGAAGRSPAAYQLAAGAGVFDELEVLAAAVLAGAAVLVVDVPADLPEESELLDDSAL